MTWLCHRSCPHCYEERFRPYYGEDLQRVVEQSRTNTPRIIQNLPESMQYRDIQDPLAPAKRGRIILAGGEILLEAVRESVLYPAISQLRAKYADVGGVQIVVQTTGDLLTLRIVEELKGLGVDTISVSGLDQFHAGLEAEEAREALRMKCRGFFEAAEFEDYSFFGATEDMWIGKLWPRGRAMVNELSKAALTDNFCNQWSGGLNFLQYRHSGSEVSIDPAGDVFPCCLKTKLALGNLLEQPLESILESKIGNPVYEAISMGHPERMGISRGWSVEKFLEKSRMRKDDGSTYANLCIGCDRFHEEVLGAGGLVSIQS